MQLVIDGQKIISAGIDNVIYKLLPEQEIIKLPDNVWKGYRKCNVHWDGKKIIESPVPVPDPTPEEIAAEKDKLFKERFFNELPEMIASLKEDETISVLKDKIVEMKNEIYNA